MTKKILSTTFLSTILLTSLIATVGIQPVFADTEIITIRSNADHTFLAVDTPGKPFAHAFTPGDFAAASSGPNAFVIPHHNAWKPHLDLDPTGTYIGNANVNPNHFGPNFQLISTLYAIDFEITSDSIDSATLDIHFLVDNLLGWDASYGQGGATNEGVFINGQPVSGTILPAVCGFCSDHSFTGLDISGLVNPGTNTLYVYAADFGQPQGLQYLANITVESTSVIQADVDIKPGSDENPVNTKSKGVIPVAVYSTEDFDATTIDPLSVTFGPNGATESHGTGHIEDVNGDGLDDLVLHFKTQETGIAKGDTEATLTGTTFDGTAIQGSDTIRTN